jgi:hypothetical protein
MNLMLWRLTFAFWSLPWSALGFSLKLTTMCTGRQGNLHEARSCWKQWGSNDCVFLLLQNFYELYVLRSRTRDDFAISDCVTEQHLGLRPLWRNDTFLEVFFLSGSVSFVTRDQNVMRCDRWRSQDRPAHRRSHEVSPGLHNREINDEAGLANLRY